MILFQCFTILLFYLRNEDVYTGSLANQLPSEGDEISQMPRLFQAGIQPEITVNHIADEKVFDEISEVDTKKDINDELSHEESVDHLSDKEISQLAFPRRLYALQHSEELTDICRNPFWTELMNALERCKQCQEDDVDAVRSTIKWAESHTDISELIYRFTVCTRRFGVRVDLFAAVKTTTYLQHFPPPCDHLNTAEVSGNASGDELVGGVAGDCAAATNDSMLLQTNVQSPIVYAPTCYIPIPYPMLPHMRASVPIYPAMPYFHTYQASYNAALFAQQQHQLHQQQDLPVVDQEKGAGNDFITDIEMDCSSQTDEEEASSIVSEAGGAPHGEQREKDQHQQEQLEKTVPIIHNSVHTNEPQFQLERGQSAVV